MRLGAFPGVQPAVPSALHRPYSTQMQLRDLLSRLWPRRSRTVSAKTRYDDASRLEETTQSHYRSVTEIDASGRSTKADDDDAPPRQRRPPR
jgi:hypothetical protein